MEIKTYKQTIARSEDKNYTYKKKFIFPKESLGDLIILLGPEAVLKLLHFFEGTYLYIPKSKSVQSLITEACFHSEATRLLSEGKTRQEIIESLQKTFPKLYAKKTIEKMISQYSTELSRKQQIRIARRACLLAEIKRHKTVFKQYGMLP